MAFDISWAGEMNRLQNEMDRLFGGRSTNPLTQPRSYPPINLWENEESVVVESEIPGMEMDQFELFVNDENQLTLQGERRRPDDETGTCHREERTFGSFSRMIPLPVLVDAENVTAEYKLGVLRVTLPKKPESKPRKIQIVSG